jgi:hypothetical protein
MVLIVYHSGTYDTHVMAVNKYYSFVIVMYFVLWCPLKPQAKVAVEYERGVKIHFAKCVVFLKDNKDNYFVVVQWYDAVGRQPFDVRLCFWLTLGGFDFVASRRTQKLQFDAHQLYRQWRHNYTFRESIVGSLISERGKGL